ncbi:MAG: 2-amino-4-hydroxy-6-hydroxymethyldihydropteridine diphosphokinase [Bacteroidales bacterium]|jgi:2-amino-4-hydroxy-6-hydroxymethyldihydropteridine diphosphokinase|nr:2-amino-4-hydroxy-6-hydroxymethyldihydropteridine diphosphokinase [Bacteroidales bacterium]
MKKVILLLGGNLGDRETLLDRAREMINEQAGKILRSSSVYESAPWGFTAENNFYNQVVVVSTGLTPHELLQTVQTIENRLGRVREGKNYASRTMDIDILFYGQEIIDTPELVIPHPQLHKRKFALEPLNEILPGWIHPRYDQSIGMLLRNCEDPSEVKILGG